VGTPLGEEGFRILSLDIRSGGVAFSFPPKKERVRTGEV